MANSQAESDLDRQIQSEIDKMDKSRDQTYEEFAFVSNTGQTDENDQI